MSGLQIPLALAAKEPLGSNYFVVHSGVSQAYSILHAHLERCAAEPHHATTLFVFGEAGVGKTHFINLCKELALAIPVAVVRVYDALTPSICCEIEWQRAFIDDYQTVQREGGLLLVGSSYSALELCEDLSVRSRLVAADTLCLENPQEEELIPLLQSLAERRNLQLSRRNVDYIIRRVPRNPLSFGNLFASIDQLCATSGQPARLGMIRSVLGRPTQSE